MFHRHESEKFFFKFPKLKMLDDRAHNMLMNLSLNKFPLSPSTHQNLLKFL